MNSIRIKILEELIDNKDTFLEIEELSRISGISNEILSDHLSKLNDIGIVDIKKGNIKKYKLNMKDKRVLALNMIENLEFIRKSS
ncbi:ArsR family transcriptional regulator [Methanobrevibacter sp. DSM 116169]|uniref:ArsR family transcriptional regulator n=1 Tax=Methanobrevibacter sp. DSM 116169 TaxID=3242727 RepID=UPI0038FBFCCD